MARVVLDVWLDFVTVVPDIVVEAPVGVQTDVVKLWQNLLVVSPFNAEVAPATSVVEPDMTLVNGRTFAISDAMGSIVRPLHGIVFEDLRVISHLRITVDGSAFEQPELLASSVLTPFSSITVSRPTRRAGQAQPPDLVVQRRWLGRGYRHDFEIHNTGSDAITRSVTLSLGGDFAHIFDVKSGAAPGESAPLIEDDDAVRLVATDDSQVSVRVVFSSAPDVIHARERVVSWHISVPPGQRHTLSFAAEPIRPNTEPLTTGVSSMEKEGDFV